MVIDGERVLDDQVQYRFLSRDASGCGFILLTNYPSSHDVALICQSRRVLFTQCKAPFAVSDEAKATTGIRASINQSIEVFVKKINFILFFS